MNIPSNSLYPSINSNKYEPQPFVPELKTNSYHNLNSSFTNLQKQTAKDPLVSNPNRRNSFASEDKSDMISNKTTTATNMASLKSHDFQSKTHEISAKNYVESQFSVQNQQINVNTKENDPLNGHNFFPPNSFLKEMNLSTQTANFEGVNTNASVMRPKENQMYESGFRRNPQEKFQGTGQQFSSKYMPVNSNTSLQNIMKASEKNFSQIPLNPMAGNYKKSLMNAQAEMMNYDEDFLPEDCIFLLGEEDNNLASFRENVEKEKAKVISDIDIMVKDVMNIFEENKVKLLENIDLHYKNYISKYGLFKDLLMEFKSMKLDLPAKKIHPNFNLDLTNTSNSNLIRELEDLRYQNQMSKMFNYVTALQREKLSQIINISKELLQLSTQVANYYNSEAYGSFLKEVKGNITNSFAKRMQNINDFVKSLLPKLEASLVNNNYPYSSSQNMSKFINIAEKENDRGLSYENPMVNTKTPSAGINAMSSAGMNPMFASPFPLGNNSDNFTQNNTKFNGYNTAPNGFNPGNSGGFQEDLMKFESVATNANNKPSTGQLNNYLYKQTTNVFARNKGSPYNKLS